MKIKQILITVCIWQLISLISSFKTQFPYSRGNFDGSHFVHIATQGYAAADHAWFPFYPALIASVNSYIKEPYLSGVVVSLVSFVLALVFLQKLLALDYHKDSIFWIIIALVTFPTSFYFGMVYSESLLLLLIILAFYFARKGQWLLAGIAGGLAAYTSWMGIFLFPAFLLEWNKSPRSQLHLLYLGIVPLGLLHYMSYLQAHTGNPLAFIHVERSIVMLYQVFWRYTRAVLLNRGGVIMQTRVINEVAISFLFFCLAIYSFIKMRTSYAIFFVLIYLTPTLFGSFMSMPRYMLICFPGFILLGNILNKHSSIRKIYLVVCTMGLVMLNALFSRGILAI